MITLLLNEERNKNQLNVMKLLRIDYNDQFMHGINMNVLSQLKYIILRIYSINHYRTSVKPLESSRNSTQLDVSTCTWKRMRPRSVLKMKSGEKTSEFRFQQFCKAIQYLFIHLSESIRVSRLVLSVFEKSNLLFRNTAVEADQNSEIYFKHLEVDLEPISLILAGPVCHSQSYLSRKRAALNCFLRKVVRVSCNDNQINMYLSYIANVSLIPLLTNEDDRRQQKEPATTLIQVRTERESTACFGQTRAVDVLVSAVTVMRLVDQVTYTKCKQNKIKLSESDQWP
ncbi:Hypothetical_protein [Hexamita inflata]|uniref:Hypothetical_protein n=1 Tax=Hexamita inflata TaxID=28002 RepID=A0AA86NYJ1_9EUKA|nr:Hypothetical protein HINF_LOCUS15338 [Hexamita inflata]CAI9972569.1 Hypothetical protein HINF_LOCUS60214 [Hexamita inflata]